MATTAHVGHRIWLQGFESAFPGIAVNPVAFANTALLAPKLLEERKAGVYELDVLVASAVVALPQLVPNGVLDPIRPLMFRPDVLNDAVWLTGFEKNWMDDDRKWGFAMDVRLVLWAVNTDLVNAGEVKTAKDLLDPKWKGKIVWYDPRTPQTYAPLTAARLANGEDIVKRLLVDQQPYFVKDERQAAESLVRGGYAMICGLGLSNLQPFLDAGLGKNIKYQPIQDAMIVANSGVLWSVNRAPHPNAAKLLINWLLTKEGQQTYSKNLQVNSLRVDVEPVDAPSRPDPKTRYFYTGPQSAQAEMEKTRQLVNGLLNIKN